MSENATQEIDVAWVRTQIPDRCRQNAHVIHQQRGVNIEAVYRYLLTWCLYGEAGEVLEFWDTLFAEMEAESGTED